MSVINLFPRIPLNQLFLLHFCLWFCNMEKFEILCMWIVKQSENASLLQATITIHSIGYVFLSMIFRFIGSSANGKNFKSEKTLRVWNIENPELAWGWTEVRTWKMKRRRFPHVVSSCRIVCNEPAPSQVENLWQDQRQSPTTFKLLPPWFVSFSSPNQPDYLGAGVLKKSSTTDDATWLHSSKNPI